MSKRIIQEDENTRHLTNMIDLLQQILKSSNDSNAGLSKLGQLLKDLDVSIDYLSSAVTDKSTLGIDLDQSAFGRLAKPAKKLNETKQNKMEYTQEFLHMQKLAGIITESEYKENKS